MAARYWVNGGNGLWNSTTNWSTTSGGASGASVPTSSDDVFFDANGNSNSTISANITVLSLTIDAGYTATITHNAILGIVGNVTLGANYTIAGTSRINISANCTFTSNGKTWPNDLLIQNTDTTVTLVGNLTITGSLSFSFSGITINRTTTEVVYVDGGLGGNGVNGCSGTAEIILRGGTWSGINQPIHSNLTIQGNVTISGNVFYGNGTLTYSSGTVTTTGSTFNIEATGSGAILNTNGIVWNIFKMNLNDSVVTLTSNLSCTSFINGGTGIINHTTNETITCSNGLTLSYNTSGTAKFILTGGTWSNAALVVLSNSLDFQGNVTVSGIVRYSTGTLRYVSGSVTTTGSTLIISQCTLDTNGIIWNNVTTDTVPDKIYTINSLLSVSGTLTLSDTLTQTFAGTSGFICSSLVDVGINVNTVILQEGITYTVTNSLHCNTTRVGSVLLFTSSHASNKAILTLQPGATCACLANFTRIDASNGRPIRTFNGVVTNCDNIVSFFDLKTAGSTL
jgi:hypothetical protein